MPSFAFLRHLRVFCILPFQKVRFCNLENKKLLGDREHGNTSLCINAYIVSIFIFLRDSSFRWRKRTLLCKHIRSSTRWQAKSLLLRLFRPLQSMAFFTFVNWNVIYRRKERTNVASGIRNRRSGIGIACVKKRHNRRNNTSQ